MSRDNDTFSKCQIKGMLAKIAVIKHFMLISDVRPKCNSKHVNIASADENRTFG
jgi:hypothetical protein